MDKLHHSILKYIKSKNNINIIYSSCYVEMEGEHKILQYIKNNNIYNNNVIYGLDADLIFLSFTLHDSNIYLLRESNIINNDNSPSLEYINIDVLKQILINDIKHNVTVNNDIFNKNYIINDFIFICILLGNDFLPNIPSINISSNKKLINGLDMILYCYKKTFNSIQNYLFKIQNSNIQINLDVLVDFIDNLILFEQQYFSDLAATTNNYNNYYNNTYEQAKYNLENLKFKYNNPVNLGIDNFNDYRDRYYNHYYFILHNPTEIIENSCINYLEGLIWNLNYYFLDCISWSWFYKYNKAPFISDIRKYIKNINFNNLKFKLSKPITPFKQLFCVVPPQYSFLLPKSYQYYQLNENSELIYLFPKDFKLDYLYQNKYWKCLPLIPNISYDDLNILDKVKIHNVDINRNKNETIILNNEI